jgi:hypothetical protein
MSAWDLNSIGCGYKPGTGEDTAIAYPCRVQMGSGEAPASTNARRSSAGRSSPKKEILTVVNLSQVDVVPHGGENTQ